MQLAMQCFYHLMHEIVLVLCVKEEGMLCMTKAEGPFSWSEHGICYDNYDCSSIFLDMKHCEYYDKYTLLSSLSCNRNDTGV